MKIHYWFHARKASGRPEETWTVDAPMTQDAFWAAAIARHPALEALRPCCRLARNEQFMVPGETLCDTDTVAFIPPVSGG